MIYAEFSSCVDMSNFQQNVPQLMQHNRPNLPIIYPNEPITTALTFATYLMTQQKQWESL